VTLIHFAVELMEESEVEEVFEYLRNGTRPLRMRGNKKTNSFKAWKRKVKKIWMEVKDEKQPLTVENSVFFTERRGEVRIVLRKSQLEEVWEKFHTDEKTGGHQGLWSMQEDPKCLLCEGLEELAAQED
jgi:hypothetical protein